MHALAIRTVKTRTRANFALWLLTLCAFALTATRLARADISVVPTAPNTPTYILYNISGNLTISNPKHLPNAPVVIAYSSTISGSVSVHDDSIVTMAGQISGDYNAYDTSQSTLYTNLAGKLYAYNSSQVTVRQCNLGGLRTYNDSYVVVYDRDISVHPQSLFSVGSVESYNFSRIYMSGSQPLPDGTEPAAKCAASTVFAHQNSNVDMQTVNVTQGAQADGLAVLQLRGVVSSVTSWGRSGIGLYFVTCSGTVAQYESSTIGGTGGNQLTGSIVAYGWPGGGIPTNTPLHYKQGGISLGGLESDFFGVHVLNYTGNIFALGGYVELWGGHVHSNMIYGQMPKPDPNGGYLRSVVVVGTGLTFTQFAGATYLTGKLGAAGYVPNGDIWAICSGAVELTTQ